MSTPNNLPGKTPCPAIHRRRLMLSEILLIGLLLVTVIMANQVVVKADQPGTLSTSTPAAGPGPGFTRSSQPPDLFIDGLEVSQAIQRRDNSVPLVAGRPAVARLYVGVKSAQSGVAGVTARLHASRNGSELPGSPLAPFNPGGTITVPLTLNRQNLEDTLNFRLPSSWITATQVTLWAEVNPERTVAEADYGNNSSPKQTLAVETVPPLEIVVVPIAYQQNGQGVIYRPTLDADNNFGLGFLLQRLYPIAELRSSVHAELLFTGDFNGAGCSELLFKLINLRSQELSDPFAPMPIYYGVVPLAPMSCSGLAVKGYGAALGLVPFHPMIDGTPPHEIGHALGLLHSPCGNPPDPDPAYPYPGDQIGNVGVDVYEPFYYGQPLLPVTSTDIMGYCSAKWISDYNYTRLLHTLAGQVLPQVQPGLFIAGEVSSDGGTGSFSQVRAISTTQILAAPGVGDYRVELRDRANQVRFSYAFEPVRLATPDSSPNPAYFGLSLPRLTRLDKVQLWRGQVLLAEFQPPTTPE